MPRSHAPQPPPGIDDLLKVKAGHLSRMNDEAFARMFGALMGVMAEDRREEQIRFFEPVSERAWKIYESDAKYVGVSGGNGSGKSEAILGYIAALATGCLPSDAIVGPQGQSLRALFRRHFRGPINCRIVVESLTTTLHNVILPKLQWNRWTGVDEPGGRRGHWGWIPRRALIDGEWQKSWSEKNRTLTVACFDPDSPDVELGKSTIQFNSYDQSPEDFASGDFHIVAHDEPPPQAIWRENEARTMRVAGRMFLQMTWPDDPSMPVDWLMDGVYEKGLPGPRKDPAYEWIELHTTDNPHLNQQAVAEQMRNWDSVTRQVRIYGRPIRFSNLIHPDFTDVERHWCFSCGKQTVPLGERCAECDSERITAFRHVIDFEHVHTWPVVWLLDPHPRKPHMFLWVAVSPSDDWWVVADGEVAGEPADVHRAVEDEERALRLQVARRLIDPNMGASPSGVRREVSWRDEFRDAGLDCDLADDGDVGRGRINSMLKPDERTGGPRLFIHPRCTRTIMQLKRYAWDEWRHRNERDLKQMPRDRYDDFPTLLKYHANAEPTFAGLRMGAPVIGRSYARTRTPASAGRRW